ncbi:MAG: hypothetical protein WEA58_08035 [Balneolaceae bacterium]
MRSTAICRIADLAHLPNTFAYRKINYPKNLPINDAAALPHAGILALQGLVEKGKVKSGQRVLINGGGGGVF